MSIWLIVNFIPKEETAHQYWILLNVTPAKALKGSPLMSIIYLKIYTKVDWLMHRVKDKYVVKQV